MSAGKCRGNETKRFESTVRIAARLERYNRPLGADPRTSDEPRPKCGARCRSRGGEPCRASVVVVRGPGGRIRYRDRCRLHGGLSTGARTPEGRARLSEAGRRVARERWRRWREQRERERFE